MPWKELSAMQERVKFVQDHASRLYSMSELCLAYGVSRTTGYKWLDRARAGESLADRSRRPRSCPHRTAEELEWAIVAERLKHPTWGPDKLRAILERREPGIAWPSHTTMGQILQRRHLVRSRRRRSGRRSSPRDRLWMRTTAPNDVWSGDFKGQFRMTNRQYCYPLTVTDHYSRYLLGCQGLPSTAHAGAKEVFERLFRQFGLPRAIVTDNGGPFAVAGALAGLSRLSVWWIRLGIVPLTIQPGHPEQNGRHERLHRTLKAETTRPPGDDLADQQRRFDHFRDQFNHDRPHAALDQQMPAEVYQPSARTMPDRLPPPEYPGHHEVRRVSKKGEITWRGRRRFVSESLASQSIGLEEVDEGIWSVHLGAVLIARLNERTGELVSPGPLSSWPPPVAYRLPPAANSTHGNCPPCTR